jgi:hypothetical protein
MKVKPVWPGIRSFLKGSATSALVASTADDIAKLAVARAGGDWTVVHGDSGDPDSGRMRREDDSTPTRARSAIIAHHPDPKKRALGRTALRTAQVNHRRGLGLLPSQKKST